ncbi:MAG: DUF815 domain-containing protein, partial [Gammaproteobacteria bacterium]
NDLHPDESAEELLAMADRFGLWIRLHRPDQEQYLQIVEHWLTQLWPDPYPPPLLTLRLNLQMGLGSSDLHASVRELALRWAQHRGHRSGRVAYQFVRAITGKWQLSQL